MSQTQDAGLRLRTPRLTLRPADRGDARAVARLADDPGVARMTIAIPSPYPPALACDFLRRCEDADPDRTALFAIAESGGPLVGLLGFHPADDGGPELGFWLGRPYWGRGYMSEATCAALDWAGGAWGKRYVRAGHFADNEASGRVLVKAGFLYTGDVTRRFSLARDEAVQTREMVWLA